MINSNLFIQYHNADKLECFPTYGIDFNSLVSDIILNDTISNKPWIYTTKKAVRKSVDSICFLIVGKTENKIKNYYLWCYFKIKNCSTDDYDTIEVSGIGQDLKYPILLNPLPDFDNFKKFCGNFGIGFQNIDNHIFCQTLNSYTIELKEDNVQKSDKEKLKILLQD